MLTLDRRRADVEEFLFFDPFDERGVVWDFVVIVSHITLRTESCWLSGWKLLKVSAAVFPTTRVIQVYPLINVRI